MNEIIVVNITWNPFGWKDNTFINPKAGHDYARNHVGGESLNFKFDKSGIDNRMFVYGYAQLTNSPVNFQKNGLIIFYSQNTDKRKGQIVGFYGNAEIFPVKSTDVKFQKTPYSSNLKGEKDYSLLLSKPLEANNFKDRPDQRLVGRIGFTYKDVDFAEKVLLEAIKDSSIDFERQLEYQKLVGIYELYTGKKVKIPFINEDEKEQKELEDIYSKMSKAELLDYINNLRDGDSKVVVVKRKSYKRNNKTIALIKILRGYKCQICSKSILRKDGTKYIEAAHIKPKHQKGIEKPENILLLCPNHHKEFDLGDLKDVITEKTKIQFVLNGTTHKISLTF
ncbi:MAG: HNH endonuclease [Flavobacterium sp.]|nr:HNH endonuclease [Flavobacterium sp.]